MLGAEFALCQCNGNEVRGRRDRGALAPSFTGADQTGRTREMCLLTTGGLISVMPQAALACVHKCAYTGGMVQWGPDKATANSRKHRVDFADAATALEDEMAVTVPDDDPDEERFVTPGEDALGRLQVVVYIWRNEEPRLISARKAEPHERRQYERTR